MHFYEIKEYYSVLTNGQTELEIICSKNEAGVDPGKHVFGQDGAGNMYIDGVLAHVEMREREFV